MSLLTARGQEKLKNPLNNYPNSVDNFEYVTGQNLGGKKRGLDTISYGLYTLSTLNAIAAGSTQRVIVKVAHGARANDVLFFTSGINLGIGIQILDCPTADILILAANPEGTTAIGDLFSIKRPIAMELSSTGATLATVSSQSQTGSFSEDLTCSTVAETFIAPAGAFACFIEVKDTNPVNMRVKMGPAELATTTSGIQFQPGRSEQYDGGSNISYCTESGVVGEISVQWFIRV